MKRLFWFMLLVLSCIIITWLIWKNHKSQDIRTGTQVFQSEFK
jgi:hypothetical protein